MGWLDAGSRVDTLRRAHPIRRAAEAHATRGQDLGVWQAIVAGLPREEPRVGARDAGAAQGAVAV